MNLYDSELFQWFILNYFLIYKNTISFLWVLLWFREDQNSLTLKSLWIRTKTWNISEIVLSQNWLPLNLMYSQFWSQSRKNCFNISYILYAWDPKSSLLQKLLFQLYWTAANCGTVVILCQKAQKWIQIFASVYNACSSELIKTTSLVDWVTFGNNWSY